MFSLPSSRGSVDLVACYSKYPKTSKKNSSNISLKYFPDLQNKNDSFFSACQTHNVSTSVKTCDYF